MKHQHLVKLLHKWESFFFFFWSSAIAITVSFFRGWDLHWKTRHHLPPLSGFITAKSSFYAAKKLHTASAYVVGSSVWFDAKHSSEWKRVFFTKQSSNILQSDIHKVITELYDTLLPHRSGCWSSFLFNYIQIIIYLSVPVSTTVRNSRIIQHILLSCTTLLLNNNKRLRNAYS